MDWENGKGNISNLELGHIFNRIMEKKIVFEEVSFTHFYQEFSYKVNQLSKEALILEKVFFLVHVPISLSIKKNMNALIYTLK
jgi:hypothetical protein